jgi:deoxyribodipyrimidine photolyase-related protein
MATFADGGILASKPYLAGGNYINKMSDHCSVCAYRVSRKTGEGACPFNYLYWDFVARQRDALAEQGRISLTVAAYDKKTAAEKEAIAESARSFIARLPRWYGEELKFPRATRES